MIKLNLAKTTLITKINIMKKNQELIAEKAAMGDDLSINLVKSGERLLETQTVVTMKLFENDFDLWFKSHESIADVEGIA